MKSRAMLIFACTGAIMLSLVACSSAGSSVGTSSDSSVQAQKGMPVPDEKVGDDKEVIDEGGDSSDGEDRVDKPLDVQVDIGVNSDAP